MRFQQAPYRIADVVALLFIAHGNTSFGSLAPIIPYRSCKHYLEFAYSEGPSHEKCGFMLANTKERENDLVDKKVLDRTSIRVLEKLNNFEHSSSKTWVFGDDALLPVMESIGIDRAEFDKCIRFLEGKGYLKCDDWSYPDRFELSYKGIHYEEFIKLEALKNEP